MSNMQKKRILLVVRYPVGGILSYIKYIYRQPCFDEYMFTILAPGPELQAVFEKLFNQCGSEFIICKNGADMIMKSWRYLRENQVDLVHSHGFTAGCLSVIPAKYSQIPHLMTMHDVLQDDQFVGIKGNLMKTVLPTVFNKIDVIHTVSHDATDNFKLFAPKLNEKKIAIIPHGIDVDRFAEAEKTDFRTASEYETFLVGFFGRFMSQKGFRYLVDAVDIIQRNKLSDRKLLVLTFGWGGFIREEYQNIEEKGLQDFFRMIPFTDDMPGAIKGVDMVAMPSLWEACGLLGMEALVAGVPIVGTHCIGLREVLRDSPAVMVAPRNSLVLAEAIANEMNCPRTDEFNVYAPIAKERFTLTKPTSGLKALYDQMILNQ